MCIVVKVLNVFSYNIIYFIMHRDDDRNIVSIMTGNMQLNIETLGSPSFKN